MPRLIDALAAISVPAERALRVRAVVAEQILSYLDHGSIGSELAAFLTRNNTAAEMLSERDRPDSDLLRRIYPSVERTVWALTDRHAYFVTPDMTALIREGARDLPNVGLTESDLPSPTGIAYLSDPTDPLVVLWCVGPSDEDGTALFIQLATADGLRLHLGNIGTAQQGLPAGVNVRQCPLPTLALTLSHPGSDTPPPVATIGGFLPTPEHEHPLYRDWTDEQFYGLFLSFVHMFHQDSTETDVEEQVTRSSSATRRKASRPTQVTYLRYRPQRPPVTSAAGTSGREHTHRWIVRGHWRRQWYASEQRHRPIWISTYIAGPAEAPLRLSDKVTLI